MLYLQGLLVAAITPALVTALPSASPGVLESREYPEFVPGPGLPSLASLNLTTEDLYAAPKYLPDDPSGPKAEYNDNCGDGRTGLVTANVDDVIACFNYLVALGNYVITVTERDTMNGVPYFREVAHSGSAYIEGHSLRSGGTSSTAYNVALGVQWSFTNCNHGGQVGGMAAAYGNGDLVVISSGHSQFRASKPSGIGKL
ncbi:hypothetical protein PG990_012285 [Apiospora arundinis]